MAQWIKTPLNEYASLAHVELLSVAFNPTDQKPYVIARMTSGENIFLRGPFADVPTAQAALDNAITNNLGGSF